MDAISDVSRGSQIYSSVPPRLPLPDPLDLDEVLGFNEYKRKRNDYGVVNEVSNFDKNTVFINEVDSFCSKYLVRVLSREETLNEPLKLVEDGNFDEDYKKIKKYGKKSNSAPGGKDATEKIPKDISKKGGKSPKSLKDAITKTKKKKLTAKPIEDVICENIESMHGIVEEENDKYDTSRLTVAEYYEWLELEPGSERDDFLKEKLGKYVEELKTDNLLKHNDYMEYKYATTNIQDIKHFNIIGTLKNNSKHEDHVQEGVSKIINMSENNRAFYEHISKCGFIIYFINEDYKQAVEALSVFNSLLKYLDENTESIQAGRPLFILVSSFMTWALTKPLDPNDLELPFTEKDYRKRIPHPNYQLHYELEEQIIKARMYNKIDSIILTCGIPYGHDESVFNYLFETAYNYNDLHIYCSGNNLLPIIHVENLALVIKEILQRRNEINVQFLFINDKLSYSLKDLVNALCNGLGSGCYRKMPEVYAFLNDYISQDIYDQTTVSINLQSCYPILDEKDVTWKYKEGFVNNIKSLIDEFIQAKNKIKPQCVIFYGSQNINMTNLPLLLSKHYNVPYLSIDNVVNDYIANVVEKPQYLDRDTNMETSKHLEMGDNIIDVNGEGKRDCGDIFKLDKSIDIFKKLNYKELKDTSKLSDTQKVNILKEKLKENFCFYHGYILTEFPNNLHQAEMLFSLNESKSLYESKISTTCRYPDYIVYLHEPQDHVVENAQSLDLQEQNNNIEHVTISQDETHDDVETLSTVKVDQSFDINEITLMNYFQEINDNCKLIVIHTTRNDNSEKVLKNILSEIEGIEEAKQQPGAFPESEKGVFKDYVSDRDIHMENMPGIHIQNELFTRLKDQEEIILSIKSYPLLNYLINFVYPTLTNALLEVTKHRYEDPLDFLSEYIFKENPHGRMIDPKEFISKDTDKYLGFPNIDSKTCLA